MAGESETKWASMAKCVDCGGELFKKNSGTSCHTASVWTGAVWEQVRHGTKVCKECGARHKLNYIARTGFKSNIIKPADLEGNPIILVHAQTGFTLQYLRQLWNRVCRTGCGARGEAATILLTYPDVRIGCSEKNPHKGKKKSMDESHLSTRLTQGLFMLLRFNEGVFDFDVDDPVPSGDKTYDQTNEGVHVIFNAARDDPEFKSTRTKFDIVTDGNIQCHRTLEPKERKFARKNLPGRPKNKKPATDSSTSRCAAVRKHEKMKAARTHTGGVFVSMNMKNRKGGNNEVLHLAEMLNGENTEYKKKCLQDMKGAKMKVGKYAHDCSCVVAPQFEGVLCDTCYLDGYHGKKHKCRTPVLKHKKRLNSQAAEQFWSRLNKLYGVSKMTRPHYRCFLRHYCIWRNNTNALQSVSNPCTSRRQVMKRRF